MLKIFDKYQWLDWKRNKPSK